MFEKGKWYVNPNWMPKSIMKFSYSIDTKLYFTEAFKEGKYAINDKWWSDSENKTRLATQEEISQYLPDNHPDKIKVTQDEFKIGDWVIGWFNNGTQYHKKAWQIGKIDEEYAHPKKNIGWNTSISEIRKAKLEEIPVKDLSNEEILEIAKQYYPIGTKFKSAIGGYEDKVYIVNDDLSNPNKNQWFFGSTGNKSLIICVKDNQGNEVKGYGRYILCQGKWAEIISTSQEVKDDFILPKKWFIIRNKENYRIVNKWENDTHHGGDKYAACMNDAAYMFSDRPYTGNKNFIKGYTEITTEQFKKYVLGEKVENKTEELERWLIKGEENKFIKPQDTNEIYIPTITKQKKKIDYTINSVFADIKINLPEKPKKIVKPILLEKFNLII